MKHTIPIVLVATVLVAGIIAFVPINEASTVHTTIQNSQLQIKTATDTFQTNNGAGNGNLNDNATFTLTLTGPFILENAYLECDPGDVGATETVLCGAGEDMDLLSINVDGQITATTTAVTAVGGTDTEADATRVLSIYGSGGDATADAFGVNGKIGAVSVIVFNMQNDTDSDTDADDGFVVTLRVVVLTAGTTPVTAAEIASADT